jgi:imidazolonepropionase-like amidohydrolase
VYGPRILVEHGVPVAFKSDHPVLNSVSRVW